MQRTRIKICGITREIDLHAAVLAGVDALGFVAYPNSPRYVSPQRAAQLAQQLPPFVTPVLLFVNASRDEIAAYLNSFPGYTLQFHGDESPADCTRYDRAFIKAARLKEGFDLTTFAQTFKNAQALLLDVDNPAYGGTGLSFDWNLVPPQLPLPLILSGGLTPHNVAAGMTQIRPYAVDVSSGVEQSKGIKDASKIQAFVQAVRALDHA